MKEDIDFKFGENISVPLNEYFTTHISDIINDLVFKGQRDGDVHKKFLEDEKFFKDSLIDCACNYIERKFWNITKRAFEIMFSDEIIYRDCLMMYETLYNLKNSMNNY